MSNTSVTLANGLKMPLVGLGTASIKDPQATTDIIRAAFDAGYRHLDTAIIYQNHKVLGDALAQIFSEGKYKREDIFITTKIVPFSNLNAVTELQQSLVDLRLTYVDLYLLHSPVGGYTGQPLKPNFKPQHVAWFELEEAQKQNLTRSIGVSNYNVQSLANILSLATIPPVTNQVELHVYLQQPELVRFCQALNVVVTAYSPLARGGADVKVQLGNKFDLFNEPILVEIAQKHNKSVAQIALNFLVRHQIVVIPKTDKIARLKENFEIFDINLTEEEIQQIRSLNKNLRTIDPKNEKIPLFSNFDIYA